MFECENCGRKQENGYYVCLSCGTHRNKQTDSERKNKEVSKKLKKVFTSRKHSCTITLT